MEGEPFYREEEPPPDFAGDAEVTSLCRAINSKLEDHTRASRYNPCNGGCLIVKPLDVSGVPWEFVKEGTEARIYKGVFSHWGVDHVAIFKKRFGGDEKMMDECVMTLFVAAFAFRKVVHLIDLPPIFGENVLPLPVFFWRCDGRLYFCAAQKFGGPSLEEAGEIMPKETRKKRYQDILETCLFFHTLGVKHHDWHPGNVVIGPGPLNEAQAIDFGLARLQNTPGSSPFDGLEFSDIDISLFPELGNEPLREEELGPQYKTWFNAGEVSTFHRVMVIQCLEQFQISDPFNRTTKCPPPKESSYYLFIGRISCPHKCSDHWGVAVRVNCLENVRIALRKTDFPQICTTFEELRHMKLTFYEIQAVNLRPISLVGRHVVLGFDEAFAVKIVEIDNGSE